MPSRKYSRLGRWLSITQIWVKTLKSQMVERVARMRKMGLRTGKVMWRNTCQAPAPSTLAASSSSAGTWVRPACRVMATNGSAPHTTTRTITANPWSGWSNQLCCS
jgi:hypothetical protein